MSGPISSRVCNKWSPQSWITLVVPGPYFCLESKGKLGPFLFSHAVCSPSPLTPLGGDPCKNKPFKGSCHEKNLFDSRRCGEISNKHSRRKLKSTECKCTAFLRAKIQVSCHETNQQPCYFSMLKLRRRWWWWRKIWEFLAIFNNGFMPGSQAVRCYSFARE